MTTTVANNTTNIQKEVILTGFLGGQYRSWKKIYFQLNATTLIYCISDHEGDLESRREIDLTEGRRTRQKKCTGVFTRPDDVFFGIIVEGRTYYMYGTDEKELKKWRKELHKINDKHSKVIINDNGGKRDHEIMKILRSELI